MNLQEIENILAEWASSIPEIKKVYLYGSRIKETHKEDSDIDIAIEFDQQIIASTADDKGRGKWASNKHKWLELLQNKIPIKVHLELYHPEETTRIKNALKEASRVVYKKSFTSQKK